MASFIATTNNTRPLTDPSGSRRFICIKADEIDHTSRVNYPQLYAQVKAEIQAGKPYFFRDADNRRIMQSNADFMRVSDYPTMIATLFQPSARCTKANVMYLSEIIELLKQHFPTFNHTNNADRQLGRTLLNMGYIRVHRASGNAYCIALKSQFVST